MFVAPCPSVPSLVVALNRGVAVAECDGAAAGSDRAPQRLCDGKRRYATPCVTQARRRRETTQYLRDRSVNLDGVSDEGREALLSALTTEHFVLQSTRGVIRSEAAARSTLSIGAVSSALVALGFASELVGDAFGSFVAAVLPGLVALGEFTFVRLVEISVEDLRYLRQIQRIRGYYGNLHPMPAGSSRPERTTTSVTSGCFG